MYGPWDDEFAAAPPCDAMRLEDFGMAPAREQQPSGLLKKQNMVREAGGRYPNPN